MMKKSQSQKRKTNRKLLIKLSLATFIALYPHAAPAQNLNCFEDMIFGEIVPCGAAGTVTVRPDNTTASSCVTVGGAPQSRARCIVTQSFPFRPIQISLTAAAQTINDGGGNTMSVTNFNIITNAGGTNTTITAPFVNIPIGATLNVGGTQAEGTYTGTFGVTAVLN